MEQVSLEYSTKNIPVPSIKSYLKLLIASGEHLIHKARWKSHIFLNPQEAPNNKEHYDFKSLRKAPIVSLLKPFEDRIMQLLK